MKTLLILLSSALVSVAQPPEALLLSLPRGASFSPSSLSGLKFWLNNDSLSGSDGDLVNLWTNSAAVNGFTNGIATTIPFLTNNVVNGRPALAFDGANDILLSTGGFDTLNNVASATAFLVAKRNVSSANDALFIFSTAVAGTARFTLWLSSSSLMYIAGRRLDADSFTFTDTAGYPTGWVLYTPEALWTSSDARWRTNGVQAINDTSWGTAGNTEATDSADISLGAVSTGSPWSGWIAEFLVYVPALSAGDRALVETYLQTKFALW